MGIPAFSGGRLFSAKRGENVGLEQIRENCEYFDLLRASKIHDSGRFFGDTSEYMRISVNWKDRKLVIFNVYR
jgi:hypothetical protein